VALLFLGQHADALVRQKPAVHNLEHHARHLFRFAPMLRPGSEDDDTMTAASKIARRGSKECSTRGRLSLAQTFPAGGINPKDLRPFSRVFKDGYSYANCLKDQVYEDRLQFGRDLHFAPESSSNVSVVRYLDIVPKEDQELMTHDVCFKFCRTIPHMNFFGIRNARDCYCMPFYGAAAEDDSRCTALCEGKATSFCGGKTKSSIFEMHMCDDTAKRLSNSSNGGVLVAHNTQTLAMALNSTAYNMHKAAEDMQRLFGATGDVVASDEMQVTKMWAGELEEWANDAFNSTIQVTQGVEAANGIANADFSKSDKLAQAERVMKSLATSKKEAQQEGEAALKLYEQATRGLGQSARIQQYYPLTYFVDKTFVHAPSTCGGDWDERTIFGVTPDECAAACDQQLQAPGCVGFSYYETGLCLLFSRFKSVMFYTECGPLEPPAFIDRSSTASAPLYYFDFSNAKVGQNNLGGWGPDSGTEELRFVGVGLLGGSKIDLRVTADAHYSKAPWATNGLHNKMAKINVQRGVKSTLTFTFLNGSSNQPVTVQEFFVSFFDLDLPDDGSVEEKITVGGFTKSYLQEQQEYTVTQETDGRTTYTSIGKGDSCDNPDDPMNLRVKQCTYGPVSQARRSVGFRFVNVSKFVITINIRCTQEPLCGESGRNLFLGTPSSIEPPLSDRLPYTTTTRTTPTTPTTTTHASTTTAAIMQDEMLTSEPISISTPPPSTQPPPPQPMSSSTKSPENKNEAAEIIIEEDSQLGPARGVTRCFAKLEHFEGISLNPDPTGKCSLCLKEVMKAQRCFRPKRS